MICTDTAIFGLPGEKVQQCGQGLPNKTETDPENAVADDFAMSFEGQGGGDEGELDDHADECDTCGLVIKLINLVTRKSMRGDTIMKPPGRKKEPGAYLECCVLGHRRPAHARILKTQKPWRSQEDGYNLFPPEASKRAAS